ncbi:hypothetical protein M3D71_001690 [Micrococcus luteus]|nr:hypothetical protein [Micrococcus luteus]MCV7519541.1 hypothetical protein [Micrococcus luteus]MCV7623696.1 hypothetical protein [Micrococcus luteus]
MTDLLKDLLNIPAETGAEDYVLRLTDSVGERSRSALLDYVVTEDIAAAFDQALGLVSDALAENTSRAAFLVGTFGSGKSHFMAVMHALLRQDPQARSIPELGPVLHRHDPALRERKILPLVFHMLGRTSFEEAIYGGYLTQVRALHPDAPLPALHATDQVLQDADTYRQDLGDAKFFARLNGGATDVDEDPDDPWGSVVEGEQWNAVRYAQARAAAPENPLRQELVTALTRTLFTSYTKQADHVPLDTGLRVISEHAKSLGYDAVTLFLDELVLWLAFAATDVGFFRRETQKLTQLVEANDARRAVPIISFVARQMDLKQWFADAGASGNEQAALDQAFAHQSGRFAEIPLGDDNLPYVAHRRLLAPKDDDAAARLEDAFRAIKDESGAGWNVLLDGVNTDERHRGADEAAFRLTYPFSPALISTLRSLASSMQRERTALKVMKQMLVDRRDRLTVDELIPVGDAYPYLVEGQKPLDATAQALFSSAQNLWAQKWEPLLRSKHGLTPEQASAPDENVPVGYRTDRRLARTLLLSAIAPKVPALRDLTPARLAALNHGSIVAPLPGKEAQIVLGKVKEWAQQIPEIHVDGDGRSPIIRLRLAEVDYEKVVERARAEDNPGRRRELIQQTLLELLGVDATARENLFNTKSVPVTWRGSAREVDLVFGNVREASWLPDDVFEERPGTWRLVIDHPFDEVGHTTAEDLARVEQLRSSSRERQTVVWVPAFLSEERLRDLSRLVILDWLFEGVGDRWDQHSDHLNENDRRIARAMLEGQRDALRDSLRLTLEQAYGIAHPSTGALEAGTAEHKMLTSLHRGFADTELTEPSFSTAFGALVDRMFSFSHPDHPRFEPGDQLVTVRQLTHVYQHMERAMADPDRRVTLGDGTADVRRIAEPLRVGKTAETVFLFGSNQFAFWNGVISRASGDRAQDAEERLTVATLRCWIGTADPDWGLSRELENLIILGWALQHQRSWYMGGAAMAAPDVHKVHDAMELRQQPMPTPEEWAGTVETAGILFGTRVNPYLTGPAMTELTGLVNHAAADALPATQTLATALTAARAQAPAELGLREDADRERLAHLAVDLLGRWSRLSGKALVESLAAVRDSVDPVHLSTSIGTQAADVARAVKSVRWKPMSDAVRKDTDEARQLAQDVRRVWHANQHEVHLPQVLPSLEERAYDLAVSGDGPAPGPTPPDAIPDPLTNPEQIPLPSVRQGAATGRGRLGLTDALQRARTAAEAVLDEHPDANVEITWRVVE